MDYSKLLASLQRTFINQDKFLFDKHVPAFEQNGKFLGDYFNQIAVEPRSDSPPRFYHTFSPFDVISNKSPQYAVVFEDGNLLLNIDFENYVAMRTGAMNAVVLKGLGINTVQDKKVLLFGSGKIASQAVKILSSELKLTSIDVITKSDDLSKIQMAVAHDSITIRPGKYEDIPNYDIIICHTQSSATLFPENMIDKIKKGAILTSFISSTEHGELPDNFYDSSKANIIVDWHKTIDGAKDMQRASEAKLFNSEDVIYIKDLLSGKKIDQDKDYTVYRSTGTPIQNLAVLKELLGDK